MESREAREVVREMRVTGQSRGKIAVPIKGVKSEKFNSHHVPRRQDAGVAVAGLTH
jgi:hypothetical protein